MRGLPGRAGLTVAAVVAAGLLVGCSPGAAEQSGLQVSDLSASPSAPSAAPSGSSAASSSVPSSSVPSSSVPSSSVPSSSVPSSSSSSSVVTSAVVAKVPPDVAGYTYLDPPATATAAFSKLAGAYPGVFGVPVVRTVKQENNSVGTVGFLPVSAGSAGSAGPGVEDGVIQGLVQGMSGKGYTITTQSVAGHKLVLAAGVQGTIVAWYRDGVVAVVTSTNPPPRPLAFATAALS
jgi:hypothetical protein